MESGKADVFLTYCTNAILARKELPSLQIVEIPPRAERRRRIWDGRAQGRARAGNPARPLILGEEGQSILVKHGFGRGDPANM